MRQKHLDVKLNGHIVIPVDAGGMSWHLIALTNGKAAASGAAGRHCLRIFRGSSNSSSLNMMAYVAKTMRPSLRGLKHSPSKEWRKQMELELIVAVFLMMMGRKGEN